MPVAETSTTAGQSLPLTAGAALSSLEDPVALGLLDFLAFWLNEALNPQLAVMTGHTATAVPDANRFAYDPQGFWVRNAKPALYIWWKSDTRAQWSTLKDMSTAAYGFMYVSDEVTAPAGSQHFAGISAAVKRALRTANDRGRHPDYNSGIPVYRDLDIASWNITRMEAGNMVPIPMSSSAPGGGGEGGIVRFFPAVVGDIEVLEVVGPPIPRVPEDVLSDSTFSIRTNESGDVGDTVEILNRVLPGPDGSEQL